MTEDHPKDIPMAKAQKLSVDKLCTIYRIHIEVLDGYAITGLLFQKDEKRRPLVIAQHGGEPVRRYL